MFLISNRLSAPADHDLRIEIYSAFTIFARQALVLEKLPMQPGEKFKTTDESFPIAFFDLAYLLRIPCKKIVWGAKIISNRHHY
jgi:hypothetical protein